MDERAAFEKAIDDNPLDATNHLVYADWLDEHGEGDEAAFRRAMGEWHAKNHQLGLDLRRGRASWGWGTGVPLNYPKGVRHSLLNAYHPGDFFNPDSDENYLGTENGAFWRTYRGMEKAFRRAMQLGKIRDESSKLARIARAVRRLRRR